MRLPHGCWPTCGVFEEFVPAAVLEDPDDLRAKVRLTIRFAVLGG
jgi:hypothetical protein